ncbi:hypothetical protein BGX38DRAFT_1188649 [Terfezia claveryi]|nr:hypothetical protein BGX38DRAFT_1188649 [Terfezia claveryi]
MPPVLTYPKTPTNTVKRLNERAAYDTTTINTIVNSCPLVHVSFIDIPPNCPHSLPFILPMIGRMGSYAYPSSSLSDPLDLYLHGYVSSRFVVLSRSSPGGLQVCVAATKLDGLVLALTPFNHSYNYRSAVLFGKAQVVEDLDEKLWAMELMTEGVVKGRWEGSRVPPDGAEMGSTNVVRVRVEGGSAKTRVGGPGDELKDLEREVVMGRVWTGVVPLHETLGEPVPGNYNQVEEVPGYLREYVKERNKGEKKYAEECVRMERIKKKAVEKEEN